MINITVKLFAQYREGRYKIAQKNYKVNTQVKELIKELGITKISPLGVLMINSRHESEEYILKEGDIVALFPKIGGG
jgi:molybdopterin converting factor small subunit